MKTIANLRQQLRQGKFEFSRHAFKRAIERNISDEEIIQASEELQVVEEYPEDKYASSCLLLGFTQTGRPLHIQASFADSESALIITLYEPDKNEWLQHKQRIK